MGTYFSVDASFWTDADVIDNFTPEDKYFYLYLLTSIHGNISGCYELSVKQAAYETGYSKESVEHLIERFISVHKMIDYDPATKEVLIHKWGKHHWTTSDKYLTALKKKVAEVKSSKFKTYLTAIVERFECIDDLEDTVWIPYQYGMDTSFLSITNIISPTSDKEDTGDKIDRGAGKGREGEKKPESKPPEKKGVFEEFACEDKELLSALKDFERMRKEMKKPMTERAKRMLINKLKKDFAKEEWVATLEQSIFHGWDTVWPLRDEESWNGGGTRNGAGSNRFGGYGKAGRKDQGSGKDYSDLKYSLDPDDESTWGARTG